MKTKTISCICLAFVLVLGAISFYNVQGSEAETQPPDLRTRKSGSDWSRFLGPTGDGKSPETDLLTSWPPGGPLVVWEKEIGTSYGAPTVSQGRLFMFDRHGRFAHLTCMKSETGEELWRFEYPTDYEDLYGYNNGPRTCPVVDGNRVYIFGAEGMLHCVTVSDGKLLWSLDTTAKFHVVQNFFGVGSAPVIEGELLIVQIGGSPPGRAKTLLDRPQIPFKETAAVSSLSTSGPAKLSIKLPMNWQAIQRRRLQRSTPADGVSPLPAAVWLVSTLAPERWISTTHGEPKSLNLSTLPTRSWLKISYLSARHTV